VRATEEVHTQSSGESDSSRTVSSSSLDDDEDNMLDDEHGEWISFLSVEDAHALMAASWHLSAVAGASAAHRLEHARF
jgi:hypothetical protein